MKNLKIFGKTSPRQIFFFQFYYFIKDLSKISAIWCWYCIMNRKRQIISSLAVSTPCGQLTDEGVKALWLVFPVDSQEIDGDASQHDGQAGATDKGLGVKGEDEQEGPEDEVNDRPNQADLQDTTQNATFIIKLM